MKRFIDSKFMTAAEKEIVLKQWKKFLNSSFRFSDFTDRLYKHLSLHAGFIAHFNRKGFWNAYFENPEDTIAFLHQFDKDYGFKSVECGDYRWLKGEYEDINMAMCEVFEKSKKALYEELNRKVVERDLAMVHAILARHTINLSKGK